MATGIGGSGQAQYNLVIDGEPMKESDNNKPPYAVPSMASINASPCNGLKVASTFAGGGGSCTGYEMAGFEVVWANEFIPAAQDTYRINHPMTILDGRDIKKVTPEEILAQLGIAKGELDLFDGSPPCQAFSSAGKREKGWGQGKKYENGITQNNEELFNEYIRLLRGLMPKVFIAENVKGLTFGAAKVKMGEAQLDVFNKQDETILHMLMDSGYLVEWRVLDAKDYGVPQTRNRVIFMGVRKDLVEKHGVKPEWPKKFPWVYTVRDACPWIGKAVHDTQSAEFQRGGAGDVTDKPAPAVTDGKRGAQLKVEMSTGNEQFKPTFGPLDQPSPTITAMQPRLDHATCGIVKTTSVVHDTKGGHHQHGDVTDKPAPAVLSEKNMGHFTVRETTIVQQQGGAFNSEFGLDKPCPAVCATQPNQFLIYENGKPKDAATGQSLELDASREKVCDGTQKFGSVGDCAVPDAPSPTVLTPSNSVVLKEERRKFTIQEVMRICAFPDDYVLTGTYSKQWERLGNSVPPLMMKAIAEAVRDGIFARIAPLEYVQRPQIVPQAASQGQTPALAPARRGRKPTERPNTPPNGQNASTGTGELDQKWIDYWKNRA